MSISYKSNFKKTKIVRDSMLLLEEEKEKFKNKKKKSFKKIHSEKKNL
ncbi:hypothetical protein [Buchnera aphidicola]